jgi:hypothetical protein
MQLTYKGHDPWTRLHDIAEPYFPAAPSGSTMESEERVASNSNNSPATIRGLIHSLQMAEEYRDQIVPNGHFSFPEQLAEYGSSILAIR